MKLKRILAWIIDWNLSGLPAITYAITYAAIARTHGTNIVLNLLFILFVLSFPVLFVCRDVIFKGQSPARRIFKLRVIDSETRMPPSKEKLIIRNLFFFIYPIDAIMLLAKDKTIGDTVANTTVVFCDEALNEKQDFFRKNADGEKIAFCHSCGNRIDGDAIICENCGALLRGGIEIGRGNVGGIKKRSVATAIILSIITFGIYQIYWFICLTNETNRASGRTGDTSGGKAFLLTLITFGIYEFFWAHKLGEKSDIISRQKNSSNAIYLILTLFGLGIIVFALAQDTLNKAIAGK